MIFQAKKIFAILWCSVLFVLSGSIMAGCSSSDSSSSHSEEINPDDKDSTEISDSSLTYETEIFEKADYQAAGRSAFNYLAPKSEVTLYELDGSLAQTGKEFTTETTGDWGAFSFSKVSLVSPYVLIKMRGHYGYRGDPEPSYHTTDTTFYFAIADLRSEDSIYFSKASTIEAFRTLDIAQDKNIRFDKALLKARNEITTALYQDSNLVSKPFSKYARNDIEDKASRLLYLIDFAFNVNDSALCYNMLRNGLWISDSVQIARADFAFNSLTADRNPFCEAKMSSDYFAGALGIDFCRHQIQGNSVKVANELSSFNNRVLVCGQDEIWAPISLSENDTLDWSAGQDAELRNGPFTGITYAYDSILGTWTSAHLIDSIPCISSLVGAIAQQEIIGFRTLYSICTSQRFWDTTTADEYEKQQKACRGSADAQVENFDYIKKFVCKQGSTDTNPEEPEQENPATLLEREQLVNLCGEEEDFRKGVIDTTIYYHCYKGELSVANAFDLAIGHACNQEHKGYAHYQNSIYNCNGFRWSYATDSLIRDSIVDTRDNQVYKTIGIGSQVWLAENLRYDIDSSWCYGDSTEYCQYGKIYPWNEVIDVNNPKKNFCPEGWHVPNNAEFDTLTTFAQSWFKNQSIQHILGATKGWEYGGWQDSGLDLVGFGAYPLGHRTLNGAYQGRITSIFLCSADYEEDEGYVLMMNRSDFTKFVPYKQKPNLTCNVRCLKD